MARQKGAYIIVLFLSLTILIFVGIAHWSYPQGESYPTGKYEQLYNEWMERPEYARMPSPQYNPTWVRLFQNYVELIGLLGLAGFCVSLGKLLAKS